MINKEIYKTIDYNDLSYDLTISNLNAKKDSIELSFFILSNAISKYSNNYSEVIEPLGVSMLINHEFLDFIFKYHADGYIFHNMIDDRYYKITTFQTVLNQEATTLLDIYEYYFKIDTIDKKRWDFFLFISKLKANDERIENSSQMLLIKDLLDYSYCFNSKGSSEDSIDFNFIDEQRKAINKICKKYKVTLPHNEEKSIYLCASTKELLICFLTHFFKYNPSKEVKKCENCNKWFIPEKRGTKYCNRISPQYNNKTCKEAKILMNKLSNEKSNDVMYLRKKIRMKFYNPVNNYGKEKDIKILENFDKKDKEMREQLRKGIITLEEYKKWLNSHYIKKKEVL